MSAAGHIVEDTEVLLNEVARASFAHMRCQANGIAYRLVQLALQVDGVRAWFVEPPMRHIITIRFSFNMKHHLISLRYCQSRVSEKFSRFSPQVMSFSKPL